ncbi:MAG: inositol-3-phosphate synthase [Desulfobacterales bacterium]
MTDDGREEDREILLIIAGAKGAVASTLAVAATALDTRPESVTPYLTAGTKFSSLGLSSKYAIAGWDTNPAGMTSQIENYGILPKHIWEPFVPALDRIPVLGAPVHEANLSDQIKQLISDIRHLRNLFPGAIPIFIDLLPAGVQNDLVSCDQMAQLHQLAKPSQFPDLAYALAAIASGIPVVNFTPNEIEIPAVVSEAIQNNVPLAGRDGKTGQTYLKTVLASAFKARSLYVDGWYSLNILGNADGKNLMQPSHAAGKLAHKTELLNDILGYRVGEKYDFSSHKVHIDYYPPRGDAKEAWDAIDIQGLFGMPMSIRVNLFARDSILAAPLILDLANWMAALQMAKRSGPVSELGFYFKKPVGNKPPATFQEQVSALDALECECIKKCRK